MLQDLADWVAAGRRRHLLFALATIATVLFVGYYFGTFDQTIHIPFLKKYANPTLFPNDPFLELRFQHYSYFWRFFEPFYRLGVLEVAVFVVHVAVVYGTYWSLWDLSQTLFASSLAGLITVMGFSYPHIGFAGFPVIEFSLLNRTFVLPFLLLAINLFLRRRYVLAFFIIGLMYNLHVISVQFVLAMFLLDGLVEFRRIGWRTLVMPGCVPGVGAACPGLEAQRHAGGLQRAARNGFKRSRAARSTIYSIYSRPFLTSW